MKTQNIPLAIRYGIKSLLIMLLLMTMGMESKAQQDPMYTQYMFNTLALNPGYAGTRDMLSLMALSRHQWVGFEGAPSTQTVTAHTPVASKIGLGLSLIHDKVTPTSQTGLYFDYAYRINVSDKAQLSFGLKGGFNHYQFDVNGLHAPQPGSDPTLEVPVVSKYLPNFGFGLYLYADKYYFGASAPKLLENKLASGEVEVLGEAGKETRHYFFMGGMVFDLSSDVKFKPSFLTKITQASPLSLDLNANFLLREKLWLGVLYRLNDSFGAMVQYQFTPQFGVGYAFDMTTNEMRNYNSGTHEIMISYEFNFKKDKVQNPRYF